jgi:predicted O-linked N-acetylglucosamine transferase (SPINDLY family)
MTDESIWMSTMRIAPIQAVGYGHPDTTGDNNEIDYFVGGDVEKDSTDQYSETMVLLPGLAQEPAWPTAPRQNNYLDDGIVRVNCVWGPDKYNYTLLTVLAEINARVNQVYQEDFHDSTEEHEVADIRTLNHEFHFFASPGANRYAALPPFINEVRKILPNVVTHTQQEYYDYMVNAEMHDFSLNSFPFGCYNVLIESLYMGLPFLSLVGDRFYNRAGMYLNDQIGMEENNFDIPSDLVDKAVTLITDPSELKRQREQLASIDLKDKLFTLKGNHFLEAVEYMFDNHPFNETHIIGAQ